MSAAAERRAPARPGWDALLVALLAFALLQIAGLAEEAALPTRVQDVLRHPWLGGLLGDGARAAFGTVGPRPGDPVGLLLNATVVGGVLLYVLADFGRGRWAGRAKWALLILIVAAGVYLPAGKLMLLRAQSGPASYSHDGGVIQTEATIRFLLEGKNPYTEDYTQTPMAEWGFSEYRTALYHYPYLPWTFVFSAPFYLLGRAAGGYDQRLVYLLLLAGGLAAAATLAPPGRARLGLVALLALNPLMALDVIFGQNDVFVLCWLLFSLAAWAAWRRAQRRGERGTAAWAAATICFGLACAGKPTAWFMAPFFGLLLVADRPAPQGWGELLRRVPLMLRRAWPALAVFGALLLPYLAWDAWSLYDDVWRWSSGQGETGYQIWGWGASNFVLALGLVEDRFGQWPFWVAEAIVGLPLLLWLIWRQAQRNTLAAACWHYGVFLLAFFYVSRFLNENYLGFILAFLALGVLAQERDEMEGGGLAPPQRAAMPAGKGTAEAG